MLLLTMNEWLGPSRAAQAQRHERETIEPREQLMALATRLSLADALRAIRAYELAYTRAYPSVAINFTLLSVSTIDDLDDDALADARVNLVEELDPT